MQDGGVKGTLKYYAKELKLPTFGNLEEAVREYRAGQSLEEFVLELLKREYDARQEKKRQSRLKRAHFPLTKTLEEFDLTKLQHVKPEYVKQLASCDFIERHENLVLVGNPGTGKTHLMIAIGVKACLLGYKVLFYSATTLASELKEARDSYQLRRLEKTISGTDLLLLDELSYARFSQEESELIFKVIAERSERTSTVITTNLEFSKWTEMFTNTTLVAALVDRLTYRSHILNMNGKSYRLQSQKKGLDST